jgi:hypothetical protein
MPKKRCTRTAIPLCFIAAGEPGRCCAERSLVLWIWGWTKLKRYLYNIKVIRELQLERRIAALMRVQLFTTKPGVRLIIAGTDQDSTLFEQSLDSNEQ